MKRSGLKRKSPLRRSGGIKRRPGSTRYSRRERDTPYMLWVKTLRCAVLTMPMPWAVDRQTECGGEIEADHMGERGLGQKAADDTCGPLCTAHHRERTDHNGMFRNATRAQAREWRAAVIEHTRSSFGPVDRMRADWGLF